MSNTNGAKKAETQRTSTFHLPFHMIRYVCAK